MLNRSLINTAVILALSSMSGLAFASPSVNGVTAATQSAADTTPVTIGEVEKEAPPEKGTGSVSKATVKHASPTANFQSVLRSVPGFTVISSGPGNLTTTDSTFTYQGFNSDQVGINFDGIPLMNAFRGGSSGQGDDHALSPLGIGQFSGVSVYSGANTPSETGINALGGTLDYKPILPSSKFNATLTGSGGAYSGGGDTAMGGFSINSGVLPYTGTKLYASYSYLPFNSFLKHVFSINNDYYFSAVQPYNHGMSQLSLITIYNHEIAQQPENVPVDLIEKYGHNFQYPLYVTNNHTFTSAFTNIIGWKSIINRYMLAKAKFFIMQDNNDRTSYSNAAYKDGFGGSPYNPTDVESYANPSKSGIPDNTYNPTALFGSSDLGTQDHRYIDNFGNVGFTPSLVFLLPHNTVTLGGLYMASNDHSAEYWYGAQPVPETDGYNDAWDEHDNRTYTDAFLQDRISLLHHRLIINPGAKYYMVSTNCNDISGYYYNYGGDVHNTFNFWEPSLGVSFLATKNIDLYAHYGRVYKVPNISAYYSVIGNTPTPTAELVKPESVDSLDAGVRYNYGTLKTSLSYFRRSFQNKFGYFYNYQTGQTFQYNVGSALYQGFTASLSDKLPYHFNAFVNYTLTDAKYTSNFEGGDGASVTSGEYVGDVPLYNLNFGIGYNVHGFAARISDHVIGQQYINTNKGVTTGTTLKPYNVTDLNVGYTWKPGVTYAKKIGLDFYVDNLFNASYIPYEYLETSGVPTLLAQVSDPVYLGAKVTVGF